MQARLTVKYEKVLVAVTRGLLSEHFRHQSWCD